MTPAAGPARVAYVTCEPRKPQWEDDQLSADVLIERSIEVQFVAWDDSGTDWSGYDLVVVRSPWDYGGRLEEFLAWADSVGPDKLRNGPDVLRWNTDKRYLAELDGSGLPVPPTLLVAPHGPIPDFGGEVVIKPVVGSGARDTGRFGGESREDALALLEKLGDQDEVAMVQAYLPEIETAGERAILFLGGRFAYALNKKAFLPAMGVAPPDETGTAAAMLDEDLVTLTEATDEEIDLGLKTIAWLSNRFGRMPLYARIDMVSTASGPVLMEAELTEPSLYLGQAAPLELPGAVLFADAVMSELR